MLGALLDPATQPASQFLFDSPAGDIQRNLDTEHLNELVEYQQAHLREHGRYSFPTNVIVAECEGRLALVDGQHRVETMRYLARTNPEHLSRARVPVVVVQLQTPGEYDQVFVAVNKSKPVQLYADVDAWKRVLKGIDQHFRVHYRTYIREKSERPIVPNINVQSLLRHLDEGGYVRRLGLTSEQWVAEIEALNTCLVLHWRRIVPRKHVSKIMEWAPKCIARQQERPLLLSVFRKFEWVDRIALKVTQPERGHTYETMVHSEVGHREAIPQDLRQQVWNKRNSPGFNGQCYVCRQPLNFASMQCGHVVPVYAGGATVVGNLEPICGGCNRDMGTEELEGYRGRVFGGL